MKGLSANCGSDPGDNYAHLPVRATTIAKGETHDMIDRKRVAKAH
jgi:hypothetical protein